MKKQYATLELNLILFNGDMVRTSSEIEVDCENFYNDGWKEN